MPIISQLFMYTCRVLAGSSCNNKRLTAVDCTASEELVYARHFSCCTWCLLNARHNRRTQRKREHISAFVKGLRGAAKGKGHPRISEVLGMRVWANLSSGLQGCCISGGRKVGRQQLMLSSCGSSHHHSAKRSGSPLQSPHLAIMTYRAQANQHNDVN